MQTRILRNSGLLTMGILLSCALVMPLGAKDKKQVTRPLKGSGVMTIHYTPISPTVANFHNEEDGQVTFGGRYHNVGDGTTDLSTFQTLTGSGTVTVANGDTIHWVFDPASGYIIDSGNGRFENASGDFLFNILSMSDPLFLKDGSFIVTIFASYEGEITF